MAIAAAGMLLLTACGSTEQTAVNGSAESADSSQTPVGTADGDTADSAKEDAAGNSTADSAKENAAEGSTANSAKENAVRNSADSSSKVELGDDIWTGTYAGDEESVTISLKDDGTISFSFAQSGISGTAEVDGNQAVYNGDDNHVITFDMNGGILNVSVTSTEDYDTSASPLIGSYVPSYQ